MGRKSLDTLIVRHRKSVVLTKRFPKRSPMRGDERHSVSSAARSLPQMTPMNRPHIFVESQSPTGEFGHRCISFPLQLKAATYDQWFRTCGYIAVRARYTSDAGNGMDLCLGNALDDEAPVQALLNIRTSYSAHRFALFSDDFSSVRYIGTKAWNMLSTIHRRASSSF